MQFDRAVARSAAPGEIPTDARLGDEDRAAGALKRCPPTGQGEIAVYTKRLKRLEKKRDGSFPGGLNALSRASPPFLPPYRGNVNVLVNNGE